MPNEEKLLKPNLDCELCSMFAVKQPSPCTYSYSRSPWAPVPVGMLSSLIGMDFRILSRLKGIVRQMNSIRRQVLRREWSEGLHSCFLGFKSHDCHHPCVSLHSQQVTPWFSDVEILHYVHRIDKT